MMTHPFGFNCLKLFAFAGFLMISIPSVYADGDPGQLECVTKYGYAGTDGLVERQRLTSEVFNFGGGQLSFSDDFFDYQIYAQIHYASPLTATVDYLVDGRRAGLPRFSSSDQLLLESEVFRLHRTYETFISIGRLNIPTGPGGLNITSLIVECRIIGHF